MSLRESVLSGVVWSSLRSWGRQVSALVVFVVLSRLLTAEDFGLVAYASVLVAFSQIFATLGLPQAIVQRSDLDLEHLDSAFWSSLGIALLLSGLLTVLSVPIANALDQPAIAELIPWIALGMVLNAASVIQIAQLEREMKFRPVAVVSLSAELAGGIAGIAAALYGLGIWSLIGKQLATALCTNIMLWAQSPWRPSVRFSLPHLRDLLRFGINISSKQVVEFFGERSPRFLIGYFLGPAALGTFVIASRVVEAATSIIKTASSRVALPAFSQIQHVPTQARSAFHRATESLALIAVPVFVGVAVAAPRIIDTLFGTRWAASGDLLRILAFYGLITAVNFSGAALTGLGLPGWVLKMAVAHAILISGGIALMANEGLSPVCWVVSGTAFLLYPVRLLPLRARIGMRFTRLARNFAAPSLGAAMLSVGALSAEQAIAALGAPDLAILIGMGLVGAVAYLVTIRLTGRDEFHRLLELAGGLTPKRKRS